MFDESQRLRENTHLLFLLSNYAQQGTEDRAAWRDRLMQMESVEPRQLSTLHGELIAFDWIEQNTGQASPMKDGVLANCYRITLNGLREYGRFHGVKIEEKVPETPEKKGPTFPRKKKQKSDSTEALPLQPRRNRSLLCRERHNHQVQPSPPMSIHSSLRGQGIKTSVTVFTSIGYTWGLHAETAEQQLSVTYFRNKSNHPKRNPGDSVILLARLRRLAENVRKLLRHA